MHASCINLRLTGCTRAASQPARAATPDSDWRRRYNLDYVAPGSQEHLLGAGDPSDLTHNAFGHASALMQELVRAYNITTGSTAQASCACSPLHRDSSCGDPHCRWVRNTTFTAEREAQDAEYDAAMRVDEDRDEEERQREEAERALAGPVQLDVVRAARMRRLDSPTSSKGTSPTDGVGNS